MKLKPNEVVEIFSAEATNYRDLIIVYRNGSTFDILEERYYDTDYWISIEERNDQALDYLLDNYEWISHGVLVE